MKVCTAEAAREFTSLCYGAVIAAPCEYAVTLNGMPVSCILADSGQGYVIGLSDGPVIVDRSNDSFIQQVYTGTVEIRKREREEIKERSQQCRICGDMAPSTEGFDGCADDVCVDPDYAKRGGAP